MKIVRSDAARWLPSRRRFALMQLVAYFVSLRRRPASGHVLYVIDRDQSMVETYGLSLLYLAASTCYVASLLPLVLPLALLAGLLIADLLIQLCIACTALLPHGRNHTRLNSAVLLTLFFAASATMATGHAWARFPAYACLALFAANAVAGVIMLALRRRVEELERRCGA